MAIIQKIIKKYDAIAASKVPHEKEVKNKCPRNVKQNDLIYKTHMIFDSGASLWNKIATA